MGALAGGALRTAIVGAERLAPQPAKATAATRAKDGRVKLRVFLEVMPGKRGLGDELTGLSEIPVQA
jgi:hypothetical protein